MVNRISTVFEFNEKGRGLDSIKRDLRETEGSVNKVKTASKGAFAELKQNRVLQAAVFAGVAKGAQVAVNEAVNLEESINAVNVTFGQAADGVLALGENAAKSVGLSKSEFNGLAVQFSSFVDTVAGEGGDVVGVMDDLTTRAADFASVMNLDVAEAARVFQSGLAGETEPLKRFGINLSAAAVEAYALENGLAASKSEMTEAIKIQARYGLLMEETAKTAGDFANTSDSLANQQRILKAEMSNLAAEAGSVLVPALSEATGAALELFDALGWVQDFDGKIKLEVDTDTSGPKKFISELYQFATSSVFGMGGIVKDAFTNNPFSPEDIDYASTRSPRGGQGQNLGMSDSARILMDQLGVTEELATNRVMALEGAYRNVDSAIHDVGWELDQIRGNGAFDELSDDAKKAEKRVAALEGAFESLNDELSDRSAWLDVEDAAADYVQTVEDAKLATSEFGAGSREAAQASRDVERAMMDRIGAIQEYVREAENIPAEVITEVSALLDRGSVDEAERILASLERHRETVVNIRTRLLSAPSLDFGISPGSFGVGATGGIVTRPTMALIGEAGPEAVVPLNQMPGASPLPGGGTGGNMYTINVSTLDGPQVGRAVVEEIKRFERRNGPGWRAA